MDRRNFLRTLVGGVAVGAAVQQWPFRVFSFPKSLVRPRLDLGFNVFDYAGLPVVVDTMAPKDRVYWMSCNDLYEFDGKDTVKMSMRIHPETINRLLSSVKLERLS